MPNKHALALVLLLLACAGCGYTTSSLIDPQYQTVAVDIFENKTNYRDFEFTLARDLSNEIISRTRLRLASKDHADTLLTGSITKVSQNVLTETDKDQVRELQVVVTVDFEWRDLKSGRPIKKVTALSRAQEARIPLGETLDSASTRALHRLAQSIVDQMESGW